MRKFLDKNLSKILVLIFGIMFLLFPKKCGKTIELETRAKMEFDSTAIK